MKYVSKADAHPAASTPMAYLNVQMEVMSLSSVSRKKIYMSCIVGMLIVLATFFRNIDLFLTVSTRVTFVVDMLRSLIYIVLFYAWGYSLRRRIIQKQARRYMMTIADLMVFWVLVRTIKFLFFNDTHIGRYLWYLYYLPMIYIPVLALFMSLSIGKSENYHLWKWKNIMYVISAFLLGLVLTNDLHELVFRFSKGLLYMDNSDYTHEIGYFLVLGWIVICFIGAMVMLIMKSRIPQTKKLIPIPCIPLLLMVIYSVLYVVISDYIKLVAGDLTIVICLLTAAALESCIQCRLIQSNTQYDELFKCATIHSKIVDRNYQIVLSTNDTNIPPEVMRMAEKAPVLIDVGCRLLGAPIKDGHVLWIEDVSEITEILTELADKSEYLTTRKVMLQKEVETRKEEMRLVEKNRLYNHLMDQIESEIIMYSDLVNQLEKTTDHEKEMEIVAKLAVVCTHIKRRGNLIFLAEKETEIHAQEMRYALEEWLSNIRLCGVKCVCFFNLEGMVPFTDILDLYDAFQKLLIYILDSLYSMMINICEYKGQPCFLLNISCECSLSDYQGPGIDISDEGDGEWIIRISPSKRGCST